MKPVVKAFISAMEKGYVPDFAIRSGIKYLLKQRLIDMKTEELKANGQFIHKYVDVLKKSDLAIMTKEANQQHYEVPTEFYDLCLGPHKKYSSCYWDETCKTLKDAEQKALDLSIEHAQIQDGMRILELGCGWGSLSLEMAKRFPRSKITVVSNSKTQKKYIDDIASHRGFKNLEVLTRDLGRPENYEFGYDLFDRVVSIEMMEHLRNYDLFFKLVSQKMAPEGKFFIHIFTHKTTPYFFEVEGEDNWMGKYFFSGGQMPARNLFDLFDDHFVIQQKWDWNGQHYQKTLEAWLKLMDQNEVKARMLFHTTYGQEQTEAWMNRWRVFFMSCAELFGYNKGEEWAVTHYLLAKK